jgi:transcriptional regulator with XRE-family HTH domain
LLGVAVPEAVPPVLTRRVRELLRERGWSQAQLAEASGVAAAVLSRVLRGEREWRSEHVAGVAAAFAMTPEELVHGPRRGGAGGGAHLEPAFVTALTRAHASLLADNTRLAAELAAVKHQAVRVAADLASTTRDREELRLSLEGEARARAAAEAAHHATGAQLADLARELGILKAELAATRVELDTAELRLAAMQRAHGEAVATANQNFAAAKEMEQLAASGGAEVTCRFAPVMIVGEPADESSSARRRRPV